MEGFIGCLFIVLGIVASMMVGLPIFFVLWERFEPIYEKYLHLLDKTIGGKK